MRRYKVVYDFVRFPVPLKIEFARGTAIKMENNINFPNPDVTLLQITTATSALETKYNNSRGAGRQYIADMHDAKNAIDNLLRKQADYVNRIAQGDAAIILSSGFHVSKQPTPALHPEFTVKNGRNEGEMQLKHKASVKGAAWIWQHCIDPVAEDKWVWAGVSLKASFTVKGLKPGTKYWFRTACVTTKGQGAWCNPHTKIAQ